MSYKILCYHVLETSKFRCVMTLEWSSYHLRTTTMHRIIENSRGHSLNTKVLFTGKAYYSTFNKTITKVNYASLSFLQKNKGDIFESIHPTSGSFRYFIILVDAFMGWSYIWLLSTCSVVFVLLLVQSIKLSYLCNFGYTVQVAVAIP